MAVTRYLNGNSWRELDQLTNRLSQMFGTAAPLGATPGMWVPAVNVEENRDELVLTAELPGVNPSDVDLQWENGVLTLQGTKTEARREDDATRRYHLWERSYGRFERSFRLPQTVRANEVEAEIENGVLRVRIPKAAEARTRRIEIRRGSGSQPAAGELDAA